MDSKTLLSWVSGDRLVSKAATAVLTGAANAVLLLLGNFFYLESLGVQEYACLAVALALGQIVQFGNLGLNYGMTRYLRQEKGPLGTALGTAALLATVPLAASTVAYLAAQGYIENYLVEMIGQKERGVTLVLFAGLNASLAVLVEIQNGALIAFNRIQHGSVSTFVAKSGSVILAILILSLSREPRASHVLFSICIAQVIAVLYQLAILRLANGKYRIAAPSIIQLRVMLGCSSGAIVSCVATAFTFPVTRLAVGFVAGASDLTLYDLVVRVVLALRGLIEAGLRPLMYDLGGKDEWMVKKLLRRSTIAVSWIVLPFMIINFIATMGGLYYTYPEQLSKNEWLAITSIVLCFAFGASFSLLNVPSYLLLLSRGANGPIILSHALNVGINAIGLIVSWLLVPNLMVVGSAIAYLAMSILSVVIICRATKSLRW